MCLNYFVEMENHRIQFKSNLTHTTTAAVLPNANKPHRRRRVDHPHTNELPRMIGSVVCSNLQQSA